LLIRKFLPRGSQDKLVLIIVQAMDYRGAYAFKIPHRLGYAQYISVQRLSIRFKNTFLPMKVTDRILLIHQSVPKGVTLAPIVSGKKTGYGRMPIVHGRFSDGRLSLRQKIICERPRDIQFPG
jgi:hypothetical protein